MSTRDVALGQTDGVSFFPPNRDFVTDHRDSLSTALVILDDQLIHAAFLEHVLQP